MIHYKDLIPGEWIPVEKVLPEKITDYPMLTSPDFTTVLVTGYYKDSKHLVTGMANRLYNTISESGKFTSEGVWQWSNQFEKVVAWMPLPVPYNDCPAKIGDTVYNISGIEYVINDISYVAQYDGYLRSGWYLWIYDKALGPLFNKYPLPIESLGGEKFSLTPFFKSKTE